MYALREREAYALERHRYICHMCIMLHIMYSMIVIHIEG